MTENTEKEQAPLDRGSIIESLQGIRARHMLMGLMAEKDSEEQIRQMGASAAIGALLMMFEAGAFDVGAEDHVAEMLQKAKAGMTVADILEAEDD